MRAEPGGPPPGAGMRADSVNDRRVWPGPRWLTLGTEDLHVQRVKASFTWRARSVEEQASEHNPQGEVLPRALPRASWGQTSGMSDALNRWSEDACGAEEPGMGGRPRLESSGSF